jgi:hypothetical protein
MVQARGSRAKEVRVLSHARRAVALAVTSLAALLPLIAVGFDGAKRW